MDILLQQIINGLVLGSMYALIALGYTMVYGIIQLINFAHGEVLMVGALTAWSVIGGLQAAVPGMPTGSCCCWPRWPAAWPPPSSTCWSRSSPTGRCATRRAWRR
jgi:branched-subunit amino acid ABC-type transport system permease component